MLGLKGGSGRGVWATQPDPEPNPPPTCCEQEGRASVMVATSDPPRKPISKRLRYEILRRDNHTCRYCGAAASDAKLTVDHVLPVALGGSDDPNNLVAACSDCNSGKSSSNPDQPLVDQVSEHAIRWAQAVSDAALMVVLNRAQVARYVDQFWDAGWGKWTYLPVLNQPRESLPHPHDWRDVIERFYQRGLPIEVLCEAADISMRRSYVQSDQKWRYFMGVSWKRLTEIEEAARTIYDMGTMDAAQADE